MFFSISFVVYLWNCLTNWDDDDDDDDDISDNFPAHVPCMQCNLRTMANVFLLFSWEFFHQQTVVTMTFILLLQSCCSRNLVTANDWVSLDKKRLTIEEGSTGEVTCSPQNGQNGTVTWIDPLDQIVSVDNRSRIYYDSGRLTLSEANVTDSGEYVCAFNLAAGCRDEDDGRRCNATFHYVVYMMPDYFVDGMVVLAIDGFLIAVFVACFVQSVISKKRRQRKYRMQNL